MQICGKMTDGPILRIEGRVHAGEGAGMGSGGNVASCTLNKGTKVKVSMKKNHNEKNGRCRVTPPPKHLRKH